MSSLELYKTHQLSEFSQLILLDQQGNLKTSCDSIFDTSTIPPQAFIYHFPFIESIFNILLDTKPDDPELRYSKVETPHAKLPGIYDYTFTKVTLEGEWYILWSIYDYTAIYEGLRLYQQRRNELEIHRHALEQQNRELAHEKDILLRKKQTTRAGTPGSE